MPKMRVLIAATGDRRAAFAESLGVHTATPQVEIGGASTRQALFTALRHGRWQTLIIEPRFDGATADELLAAAARLVRNMNVVIVGSPEDSAASRHGDLFVAPEGLPSRIAARRPRPATWPVSPQTRIDPDTGLPRLETIEELLDHNGRHPRTGLMSCVMIDAPAQFAPEIARITLAAVGDGGIACRWRDGQSGPETPAILALRRASCPGEALIFAEGLRVRLSAALPNTPAIGVSWFDAADVSPTGVNQADHALCHSRDGRRGGAASWREVAAIQLARSVACSRPAATISERRAEFLSRISATLGPVQREHITTHSEEVAAVASELAQLLQLTPEEADHTCTAALLHDLGKAAIPDSLLAKPGPLTATERLVMDRHSAGGADLCEALDIDAAIARSVRHHHTRFDASEPAPQAARIIAVADALVTMTTTRPYSAARSYSDALAELRRCRGTIFDPRVVIAAHILGASSMAA